MSIARRLLFVLFAITMVAVAAAPHRHKTCPRVRCGVPDRDYQFRKDSQPKRSLSGPGVLIPDAPIDGDTARATLDLQTPAGQRQTRSRIKAFQFVKKSTLQIDHCSLSQMSILLHQSGHWTASMRANQNPVGENAPKAPLDATTAEPEQLATSHLLRNKFFVDVRCYAGSIVGGVEGLSGKPLVIPLYIEPFWVQRARPDHVFVSGFDPRIAEHFDSIERVEIEFAYQRD